jgi:hypothetical protein
LWAVSGPAVTSRCRDNLENSPGALSFPTRPGRTAPAPGRRVTIARRTTFNRHKGKNMIRFIAMLAVLLPLAAQAGFDEGVEAYTNGDYAKALAEFKAVSEQGNVDGTYFVGMFYHNGYGVARDEAEAYKWFSKAAQMGDPRAQYYLGIMTAGGKGVAKDPVKGAMWLVVSARNPKSSRRDSHYTKEEYEKITKKMTPEQVAEALAMANNWKPQN